MTHTIGDVLDYLKNHEAQLDIKEVQLGPNEWKVTANNVIVPVVDGKPVLPESQYSLFKKIVADLKLNPADNINTQCAGSGVTVLIKATQLHYVDLAITLVDFGGDPSKKDGHGNSAFIYAAASAHSTILKEFLTLIQVDEPPSQQHKKEDAPVPEQKAPAATATIQKAETIASPRVADLQSPKKTLEKPVARIKLEPSVLLETNAVGETPEHLIKIYQESHKAVKEAAEAKLKEDRKKIAQKLSNKLAGRTAQVKPEHQSDHVERFKKLVEEVHQAQKDHQAQLSAASPKAEKPEVPVVKQPLEENRNDYAERITKVANQYNKFFTPKFNLFVTQCKNAVKQDPDQTTLALAREAVRQREGEEVNYIGTSVAFPLYFKDKAKVQAALLLIKDYYQPESAPVSKFFQWGALRRLLTFHVGRRYTAQAEDLHTELQATPLKNADDVVSIVNTLNLRLSAILQLDHDKKNKNTIFNSSYARRLFYIIEELKTTSAYEYAEKLKLSNPDSKRTAYLNELDMNNMTAGVFPFSTKLPYRP